MKDKSKIKNKKQGISLIILLITIAVMIILLSVVVISVNNVSDNSKLASFATDLSTIEDLTSAYYMQNNSFPVYIESGKSQDEMVMSQNKILEIVGEENKESFIDELKLNNDYNEESNNLGEYYPIDLTKLDIDSSKRGTKKDGNIKDIYVVSYPSMNIYYLNGIKAKKDIYFSLSSKLTNKVKIDNNMVYNTNNTTIQSIEGLTVKKMEKGWTNIMGIYVQANLNQDESIYLEATNVSKKQLITNVGNNEFSFNDLSEVNGFTVEDSNTFKNSDQKTKKIIFTKQRGNEELGKIEIDMSNYETSLPTYEINPSEIVYSEEYNMVPIKVEDNLSKIKEVRYEYITTYNAKGNLENYYNSITKYDIEYLKSKGKRAVPDKDGNISLKIDKDIQGIQLIVIDKAGNILSQNEDGKILTIGLYNENNDIYIGLDLKHSTESLLEYNLILVNKNGILSLDITTSQDGKDYSDVRSIQVNSTSEENIKIIEDKQENLGNVKFLKVVATDNSLDKNKTTRIFKINDKKTLEIGKITNETKTYNLKDVGTYYNPVVPKGFAPINEGNAIWGDLEGWNNGLVIQDEKGNEFVWIPVVKGSYIKDFSFPGKYSYTISNTSNATLPTGVTDESYDVDKYGGFYISRYEAGIPDTQTTTSNEVGVPVSKKRKIVWTDISYSNAKASAESMISNEVVQTGLITGTAWDTTCHFIEDYIKTLDSNSSLTNSLYYGNYINSAFTYLDEKNKLNDEKIKIPTGSTEYTKTKNIYDLAGNVWEWTSEIYDSNPIYRAGSYVDDSRPVTYRNNRTNEFTTTYDNIGFRIRLYMK